MTWIGNNLLETSNQQIDQIVSGEKGLGWSATFNPCCLLHSSPGDQPPMVPGLSFYLFYDQTAVLKIERRPQTGTRKKNQHQKRLDLKTENPIKRSALQPVYTLLSFFSLPSYCGDFIWMQLQCGCPELNTTQRRRSTACWAAGKTKLSSFDSSSV